MVSGGRILVNGIGFDLTVLGWSDINTLTLFFTGVSHATVAQLVEQRTENPCVDSSILSGGKIFNPLNPKGFFCLLPNYPPINTWALVVFLSILHE